VSIPRIIHYALCGGWKLSDLDERCIATWRAVLPDYELHLWTDENGPKDRPFFRDACRLRPVNASNYIKFWALNEFGGIFLDNDVEVVRPFDLSPACFVAFQRDDVIDDCINTAVIGSEPKHPFILSCLRRLDSDQADTWPIWPGCGLPTEELRFRGLRGLNVEQVVEGVTVYDKERFYPWRWDEQPDRSRVTDRTFAIHHWASSWAK
jgi:mannosyltransferase OCH1-like enzyme